MGSNPAQKQLGCFFKNYWLLQVCFLIHANDNIYIYTIHVYSNNTTAYWVPDEVDDSPVELSRSS